MTGIPSARLVAALIVAALLALTGCDPATEEQAEEAPETESAEGDSDEGAETAPAAQQIPEIVSAVEPSVVAVVLEDGIGSGVIVDEGRVVTNAHVVGDLPEVQVQLATGRRVPAEVRAVDLQTDLAVLETGETGLPEAEFSEGLPQVGELAVAIGSPLGLENTVTAGIISGVGRAVPAGPQTPVSLVDLIQTDAPIAPGNSGGALVNAEGEVVGINVAYAPPGTGATAIGFAIPAPTVTDVVAQLIETGEVTHAFLGVQPGPLSPQLIERFDLDADEGVLLLNVVPDSPAADAGLEPGDVVTELDGEPVRGVPELLGELRRRDPGDSVTMTVLRGGDELEVEAELTEQPDSL